MPQVDFTLMDIFLSITGLSYKGDIRMKFKAENPNKVLNIVEPNFEHFLDYYQPHIDKFEQDGVIKYKGDSVFTFSHDSIQYLTDWIPSESYAKLWITQDAKYNRYDDLKYQIMTNLEVMNGKTSRMGIQKA